MARNQIFSPERVHRMLDRLAFEVIERNRGAENLEIIGIRTRGAALADELAKRIGTIEKRNFKSNRVDVHVEGQSVDTSQLHADITDRDLVLVDDVIFTGRTAHAALDAVVSYGRPRSIQLLVLIDRGHREYPIHPDYSGRVIPTKHKEQVVVEVNDTFGIYLEE